MENLLKHLRKEAGLTQRQLGKIANVAHTDICKAEHGHSPFYPNQLHRIADALGYDGEPANLLLFVEIESEGE